MCSRQTTLVPSLLRRVRAFDLPVYGVARDADGNLSLPFLQDVHARGIGAAGCEKQRPDYTDQRDCYAAHLMRLQRENVSRAKTLPSPIPS
jgi:hypothetical protein